MAQYTAEELKARFNPEGSLLRKHQMRMLELVAELDRICKKHNIPYYLYGGTLLGAIRHNGFIPWDDDLDVGLLRADYKRLMKVLPTELPDHIALQNNDTDKNYFYFFAKLRDRRSYLDEGSYDRVFKEHGVYIDIFPFERQHMWAHMLAEPMHGHCFKILRTSTDDRRAMRKVRAITWMNRHIAFPLLRAISRLTGAKTLSYSYGIPFHVRYEEKNIFPLTTHDFEGLQLPVPGNSHQMLVDHYGDYMQLPDVDNLTCAHVQRLEFFGEKE